MEEVRLCIALADQLVLEPGEEVDEVPDVLPDVEKHLSRESLGKPSSLPVWWVLDTFLR